MISSILEASKFRVPVLKGITPSLKQKTTATDLAQNSEQIRVEIYLLDICTSLGHYLYYTKRSWIVKTHVNML